MDDSYDSPLPSFISHFCSWLEKDNSNFGISVNELWKYTKRVAGNVLGNTINYYSSGIINSSTIKTFLKDKYSDQFPLPENFNEAIKATKEFTEYFKSIVDNIRKEKPFIVIIDELDRCRPDYAIRFLEDFKQYLEIENIIFIFAIDGTQLEASVKHIFGDINYYGYVRKFIHHEYRLPRLSNSQYLQIKANQAYEQEYYLNPQIHSEIEELGSFLEYTGVITYRDLDNLFNDYNIIRKRFEKNDIRRNYFTTILVLKYAYPEFFHILMDIPSTHSEIKREHMERIKVIFDFNTSWNTYLFEQIYSLCTLLKIRSNNSIESLLLYYSGTISNNNLNLDTIIPPKVMQWTKRFTDPASIAIRFQEMYL